MTRRQVIQTATLFSGSPSTLQAASSPDFYMPYWTALLDGYFRSVTGIACDFPQGTKLAHCLTRSGKTFCSVARMLPGLAAFVASGRDTNGKRFDHILTVYRDAFNPQHPDYWPTAHPAESSAVAWTLWLLRDKLPAKLTSQQRTALQIWLVSAKGELVNETVRLALQPHWPEFQGSEKKMFTMLAAMDSQQAGDGWFGHHSFDYDTFWTSASAYLYWREITNGKYANWNQRFDTGIRQLLQLAPTLLGPNGSPPLMGGSLVYRWAFLTPLVLGYRQKLWPHSPGLLRLIVLRNIDFFWRHGGFDPDLGKLNEPMSNRGTSEFPESYIDNGHPYWCMQAFAFFLINQQDPFWTANEEPLPSEKQDSMTVVKGPKLLVTNCLATGDVRLHFAANNRLDPENRDRFAKFSYSARFPFCYSKRTDRATWDSALVLHDPKTGILAGRSGIRSGKLIDGGIETDWWALIDGARVRVKSQIFPVGDKERRIHTITCPARLLERNLEVWEGSIALPVNATEPIETASTGQQLTASAAGGSVGLISHEGYQRVTVETSFNSIFGRDTINIIAPRTAIVTLRTTLHKQATTLKATFLCKPSLPKGGYK